MKLVTNGLIKIDTNFRLCGYREGSQMFIEYSHFKRFGDHKWKMYFSTSSLGERVGETSLEHLMKQSLSVNDEN